jgi:hypothetical protein
LSAAVNGGLAPYLVSIEFLYHLASSYDTWEQNNLSMCHFSRVELTPI